MLPETNGASALLLIWELHVLSSDKKKQFPMKAQVQIQVQNWSKALRTRADKSVHLVVSSNQVGERVHELDESGRAVGVIWEVLTEVSL